MKHKSLFNESTNLLEKQKKEYFLGFIEGGFGDGKTLGLVYFANRFKDNYNKICANFHLYIENSVFIEELNKEILLNLNTERKTKRILLLLQEASHYFDKRFCTTKYQKEIMEALFQIRKTNIDILCDIREHKYLDFRTVENTVLFIKANGKLKVNPNIFHYSIQKTNLIGTYLHFKPVKDILIDGSKYYNLYDTLAYTTQKRK